MIKVLIGNIFDSNAQTLVNTVNCVGVMGKGIALEFKKRFPDMMKDYKTRCTTKMIQPGEPYLFRDLIGTSILNFPTKNHWRSPSRLEDIIKGLYIFTQKYKDWGIKSIAFPPLGCGNGGLDWKIVGPLMYQSFISLDISVEIYAPFGTSHELLKPEFLATQRISHKKIKGVMHKKLKEEWVAILEVLDRLSKETYAPYVGRTVFQKICYVMTEQGFDTGFQFKQGSYGPHSQDVKDALMVFANSNLAMEQEFGRMTRLFIGSEYPSFRENFKDYLDTMKSKIDKTVDLFSRIKDTNQAEEVATVFYSARKLKKDNGKVSEQDLFDYILKWKKKWDSPEKKLSVASAIRNLVMLKWVSVQFSDDLVEDDILFI
ncbi:MAG: macro domain-containing protein [Proteobacteria bacterium]|nr:macro domain-containing protein [Pseudomonadota bacterium]MBU1389633.1 macro domain-containing protein [Pseudomonadota bacterium]MBU1542571.1 macro domain-containing protein [Pseudomonadota bacterium]MBU2429406.1 macro domain-containing protein [Pseudomonadota bacterium]MBU2479719.1 macro domain-containing protein [Pseudomonadota bacterium]